MKTLETVPGETSGRFTGGTTDEATSHLSGLPKADSQDISYKKAARISDCDYQTAENRLYKGSHQAVLHKLPTSRNKGDIYQPMVWVMALLVVAFVLGLING